MTGVYTCLPLLIQFFRETDEHCRALLTNICLVALATDCDQHSILCSHLHLHLRPALPVTCRPHLSLWIFSKVKVKVVLKMFLEESAFQVFLVCRLPLWPCNVHCGVGLALVSLLFLNVRPSQFHFLLAVFFQKF